MSPRWTASSDKHGISRRAQAFAIMHPTYRRLTGAAGVHGGRVALYTGHGHELNEREVEVLVEVFDDGQEAVIFHANNVSRNVEKYRKENPDGWVDQGG